MEKKTKKLQLRKETIAVLNGERMSHVIGGNGFQCHGTAFYGFGQNPTDPDGTIVEGCFCQEGYGFDGYKCVPFNLLSKLLGKFEPVCDVIGFSVGYCPTLQPGYDTGVVECPTGVWCK